MAEIISIDTARSRRAPSPSRKRTLIASEGRPIEDLIPSWRLSLEAASKSPKTIDGYIRSATQLVRYLKANDLPADTEGVQAEHVRGFLIAERERTCANSAGTHFRNLRVLFNWLIKEDERITPAPIHASDAPKVTRKVKVYVTEDQQRALLATCAGNSFLDRRDNAILRVLYDNGMRVSGLAGIKVAGVDLRGCLIKIVLKGGDEQLAPIVPKTAAAIDKYLRIRARHSYANSPWLWLGVRGQSVGRFTANGVRVMLARRGAEIGLEGLHPHQFRGTAAHELLAAGMHPDAVKRILGWKTDAMLREYTEELAGERARTVHAQLAPGNRF